MKRIFSSPVAALIAGVCLRLFFVLKYPANSGDTVLYEQITANYVAVPLTEVFATFFTTAALLPLCLLIMRAQNRGWRLAERHWILGGDYWRLAAWSALVVGLCTLFRPEAPLLLVAAWTVLGTILIRQRENLRWVKTTALMAALCAVPLGPWPIRNAVPLHKFKPLAPRNSNLPGELVPYGFMSWEKTWLYRFRDVYLVPWKLNEEVIDVNEVPARAFDTPAEKERVAMILDQYNEDLTLTPEEDAAFARLARERAARRPLRTCLFLPAARALTLWVTPRIELLPYSGTGFPLLQSWEDDSIDQGVTARFFLLIIGHIGLGLLGA